MSADDLQDLRRCIRDLVALSALPAIWIGLPSQGIAESLADALVGTLRLDLACVRVALPSQGVALDVARAERGPLPEEQARAAIRALSPWLEAARSGPAPSVPNPAGTGTLRLAGASLGYAGEGGLVIAGSRRPDFPSEGERLLFRVSANQAVVALQGARLYSQARDAVRAREEFLSIAAHELRNPVASMKGNAELLLRWHARGQLDAPRLERLLSTIVQGGDRLATLVDDLMDVSRLQGGQFQVDPRPTDLAALLRHVAAEQLVLAERHRLRLDIAREPCVVAIDPDRIEQVLSNLIGNAVKYSPDGGDVTLSLGDAEGGVLVRVQDQGIGLPAESIDALFQPFGRARNAEERQVPGLGLGLYICRQITERHKGRIWAESDGENRGTTICLWLPAGTRAGKTGQVDG